MAKINQRWVCLGIVVYPVTWEEAYIFSDGRKTAFVPLLKYSGESK